MTELNRAAMGAIVVGASRPQQNPDVAKRLAETAAEMRTYLEAEGGMGLGQSRVCWLFDDLRDPPEQEEAAASVVQSWANGVRSIDVNEPLNLLILIFGHAEPDGKVLLAASKRNDKYSQLNVDSFSSRLISNAPLGSRYFVYLDCCYAGAVFDEMRFEPRSGFALDSGTTDAGRPVGLTRGIWGLIAANNDLRAWAPPGDRMTRMSTLFFDVMRETPNALLSLSATRSRMIKRLKYREERLDSWKRLITPQPLIRQKTEESLEELDYSPLFQTGWRSDVPTFEFPSGPEPSRLTVLIVSRETGSHKLVDAVKFAMDGVEADSSRWLVGKHSLPAIIVELDVTHAFNDAEELSNRLSALCRADIAVFDVTALEGDAFEPGLMLLLGVRAAVRRGVTICSVDVEADSVFDYTLPYNLMFVNLSSHADPNIGTPKLLRRKILSGLKEVEENPGYLDLPVYDAVRELGDNLACYEAKPYDEGVLYLGPFERTFRRECSVPLEEVLKDTLTGLSKKRLGRNYEQDKHEPQIYRLLDSGASKLVALSLYEAIRRYDFCLVDWSNLRPNVFFEMGVRIATNEKGAVHIIAESRRDQRKLLQLETMKRLFDPIAYPQSGFPARKEAVEKILAHRQDKLTRKRNRQFFHVIATACEPPRMQGVDGLVTELRRRADLAFVYDENKKIPSAEIYANDNLAIRNAVFTKSIGFKLAAVFMGMGGAYRVESLRDELADLGQQIDQLQRNGAKDADVMALSANLELLTQMLALLRKGETS